MQEWSFSEAQFLKVFEIAPFKGQVLRLSKNWTPTEYLQLYLKYIF